MYNIHHYLINLLRKCLRCQPVRPPGPGRIINLFKSTETEVCHHYRRIITFNFIAAISFGEKIRVGTVQISGAIKRTTLDGAKDQIPTQTLSSLPKILISLENIWSLIEFHPRTVGEVFYGFPRKESIKYLFCHRWKRQTKIIARVMVVRRDSSRSITLSKKTSTDCSIIIGNGKQK
jgi:hypothetical protein